MNDREAFRQRVEWLIQNPEVRKIMGDYNAALSQQFTIRHCASRYEHIFNEIVLAAEHNGDRGRVNQ